MTKLRTLLSIGLLVVTSMAWAQKTDGLIISSEGTQHQFAIGEVKEVTFSDQGLTLIKTDDATVEFTAQWQIRFGEIDTDGVAIVEMTDSNALAQVYNVEGRLLKELPLSELRISELSKGVYIICCDGKSFKVLR